MSRLQNIRYGRRQAMNVRHGWNKRRYNGVFTYNAEAVVIDRERQRSQTGQQPVTVGEEEDVHTRVAACYYQR